MSSKREAGQGRGRGTGLGSLRSLPGMAGDPIQPHSTEKVAQQSTLSGWPSLTDSAGGQRNRRQRHVSRRLNRLGTAGRPTPI